MHLTRRAFTLGAAAALGASAQKPHALPPICLLSSCLAKVHYADLGGILSDLGFDGCDLTVRPGGHVEPALSAADMYRAVEALRGENIEVPVISTAFVSANDPTAPNPLALCGSARMKVPYFRMGDWPYRPGDNIEARLGEVRRDVAGLAALGHTYGILALFRNLSGSYAGEAVWDAKEAMAGMDPAWIGYYFDPCHATIEGGEAGWNIAMRMAMPRIKVVAVQDFYWDKSGGQWSRRMCPMGEGMVNWPQVFSMLAAARFFGPMSIDINYGQPGDMAAIAHDLKFVKKSLAEAYK